MAENPSYAIKCIHLLKLQREMSMEVVAMAIYNLPRASATIAVATSPTKLAKAVMAEIIAIAKIAVV
jgi:hypothetical protein